MAAMSLDLSVVLIVLMVWALYFVLKKSFFDPINQILTTREAASQGALEEARAQMAVVETVLRGQESPRLVHVIPNFHNPAGCTLGEDKRHRLV